MCGSQRTRRFKAHSFTKVMKVLLFEKRFWEPIFCGDKVHSIRRGRKRPIVPGDRLSLRGWEGVAYRSNQRVLCEETCLDVRPIWIDTRGVYIDGYDRLEEPEDLDRFAVSDGFATWEAMRIYRDFFYRLPFSGDFIQWGVHPFLQEMTRRANRGNASSTA